MSAQPFYEISNPVGIWRCTHSNFDDFVVGEEYPCLPSRDGGHRIYPRLEQGTWSPYWIASRAGFCYPASVLNFVFVRAISETERNAWTKRRDETAPDPVANIRFPLEFEDDAPAPQLKRKSAIRRLDHAYARDAVVFVAGAVAATLVFLIV